MGQNNAKSPPPAMTWQPERQPHIPVPDGWGYFRAARRAVPLLIGIGLLLLLLLLVRLVERPLVGERRTVTLWIKQQGCRWALFCMGIGLDRVGADSAQAGAVVANHSSWLDIFVLGAAAPVTFVSKAEVATWPLIGPLAKATGTVFITRDSREAAEQVAMMRDRFAAGQRLLFFPEGTSTDGQRVLPFRTTLFAAICAAEQSLPIAVQPVSVRYAAPVGADPLLYGWFGSMGFAAHFLAVLAQKRQGRVRVLFQPALPVTAQSDRKTLAAQSEAAVRAGLSA
ncbi:1-acyl-sn-glycerol-3-phosphate acyltransferase [Ketogulonicigenium robustum]|uniref:1-acyl-sn-glycerol-3-phosphate acyltransferase n=1 Tax=Ketogulonicigenium robustum TaxID=92947 RepID=A0A1W6P061_9RHOB|nr:lysophospholipid acyltransferase family protein [Ketogulonicigenium robustum]ARO14657.1 1-acyl-sn-glycerol-3-phosphate acyltransferase [Ketogulonicigenium robustum]